jgi:catechol-2,3-dioxygenase
MIGNTLIGLHEHPDTDVNIPFTELRTGLDHIGFGCADRTTLESWVSRLNDLGISHGGIVDADYGSGLSFRDPDGIALEFFAPPA